MEAASFLRALIERVQISSIRGPVHPLSEMALRPAALPSILQMFVQQLSSVTPTFRTRTAALLFRQLYQPLSSLPPLAVPVAISLNIPSLLSGIWESVLRAVPKKKTSHMKKRHRFMAGKALKDVTNLNKCSACGNVKRAHLLCPYCVRGRTLCSCKFEHHLPDSLEIRDMWLGRTKEKESINQVEA